MAAIVDKEEENPCDFDSLDDAIEEEPDLAELIGEDLFNHPDCFHSARWRDWEQQIATPAIGAKGFKVLGWRTDDGDSFGPLVRSVEVEKDGCRRRYFYG